MSEIAKGQWCKNLIVSPTVITDITPFSFQSLLVPLPWLPSSTCIAHQWREFHFACLLIISIIKKNILSSSSHCFILLNNLNPTRSILQWFHAFTQNCAETLFTHVHRGVCHSFSPPYCSFGNLWNELCLFCSSLFSPLPVSILVSLQLCGAECPPAGLWGAWGQPCHWASQLD